LLAETLVGLERYSEALTALDQAVARLRELGLRGLLADAEAIKAIAHDGLGQRDQAVSAARSAVAFFDEQHVRSPFRGRLDRILSGNSVNT
jgi:tetratricopeptide (TPR) repeat protein